MVYDVITDFERYPEWASGLKRVRVVADESSAKDSTGGRTRDSGIGAIPRPSEVEFEGGALGFRVYYRLKYEYDPPLKLSWELVKGEVRGPLVRVPIEELVGTYDFESVGEQETRATYALSVALPLALGPLRARAERIVMDTGLEDLKRRAETLARAQR